MFNIIIISKNQYSYIQPMSQFLKEQRFDNHLFVFDRCTDASIEIAKSLNENYIMNAKGEGFLAGKMRDIGLQTLGIENTLFLDGDRLPVNLNGDLINKALSLYDISLIRVEKDFRTIFGNDFKENRNFGNFFNDVFSCGIVIKKSMIEKILLYQTGRLFHEEFDGNFGVEDQYLGDLVYFLKGTCGCFPRSTYLKGEFTKIEDFNSYNNQVNKRLKLNEKRQRNYHGSSQSCNRHS